MAELTGTTVSHYTVLEKIGAGGMGEVYKARDLQLKRVVAMKVLPPELSIPSRKARFIQEAQAASALNHPNILTVHEVGEVGQSCFIVTEYVEGETLGEKLERGMMDWRAATEVALEIADALACAHDQGIIHRDIKAQNVMLTRDGRAKVLDFGLAKLVQPSESDSDAATETGVEPLEKTEAGVIMGTVAYMSPEQAEGRPVDTRTDIFSFGVLFYQMVTGAMPFGGRTALELRYNIVNRPPVEPHERVPNLPSGLERVILKALEKDPALRYQNFHELEADLRIVLAEPGRPVPRRVKPWSWGDWRVGILLAVLLAAVWGASWLWTRYRQGGIPPNPAVVVLPLQSASAGADQYFSDGLTESITMRLFKLGGIRVASPAAAFTYADKPRDLKRVARELGIDLVLDGRVQKSGDRIRVTLYLVNPHTGFTLWSDEFTGEATDVFRVEDEIAARVASALRIRLTPAEQQALARRPTENLEAYDLYFQGRSYLLRRDIQANLDRAVSSFEAALERDPAFALAMAGLAEACWEKYMSTRDAAWLDRAQQAAARAVAADGNLAEAHVALAKVQRSRGEADRAATEIRRALEINPRLSDAYVLLSGTLARAGKRDESVRTLQRAIELQPSWQNYNSLGATYMFFDQPEQAVGMFQKAIELAPDNVWGYNNLGAAYYRLGRYTEAEKAYLRSIEIEPRPGTYSNLGTVYYDLGRYGEAARWFQKAIDLNPGHEIGWGNLADAYRWMGGKEKEAGQAYGRAITLAEKQLTVNPKDTDVLSRLALYYAKKGEPARGIELAQRASSLEPKNSKPMYAAAIAFHLAGRRSEALAWLRKAIAQGYSRRTLEHDPEVASYRKELGLSP